MNTLFDSVVDSIVSDAQALAGRLAALPEPERIDALNRVRSLLHDVSPFRDQPVDCVQWVPAGQVRPNGHNPNHVFRPEWNLLRVSVDSNGLVFPIVCWPDGGGLEIVDGEHRAKLVTENASIRSRLKGRLPVAIVRPGRRNLFSRVAAMIQLNRAHGAHAVHDMSALVRVLLAEGHAEDQVAEALGMDADELLRMMQIGNIGQAHVGKRDYNRAWVTDGALDDGNDDEHVAD